MDALESICLENKNKKSYSIFECHEKEFNEIKDTLLIIGELKIRDKLAYSQDGVFYIDKYEWGQYLRRVLFNQSRQKTENYLNEEFTRLIRYFDKYLVFLASTPSFIIKVLDKRYEKLTEEICTFINEMIPGLYNLKKTYPDFKKLTCRIDSIIMTLVDFKDKAKANLALWVIPQENRPPSHERTLSF